VEGAVTEPILRLENVHKSFGGLKVTDDVSLDITPGEVHAIIGPNGAGKTTLLNEISGILSIDSGRILFDGKDVTRVSAHQRARMGIARTFQITSIVPGFTVLENAMLAVQAQAGSTFNFVRPEAYDSEIAAAANDVLEQVGLDGRARTPAGLLSHGEKRSLEIAIAIALKPKLVLLDEPAAGTGRGETERLVEMLAAFKSRFTIVLVEHDMQAVFALADRISVLVYGRVIASGAPADIRANPAVKAAYLGEEAA
jgi:branched-chain amino acid transport system ATP-binding protein